MRLLLVDDDTHLASALRSALSPRFLVTVAPTLQVARSVIRKEEHTVYLLDISLPDGCGTELVPLIRSLYPKASILMLSAERSTVSKVAALDAGADDFVTKPFSVRELEARIRALTRRHEQEQFYCVGDDLIISRARWSVAIRKVAVPLPRKEFLLLEYLAQHQGRLLTRDQLATRLWEGEVSGSSQLLSVHIRRLRAALEKAQCPYFIRTVSGVGYALDAEKGSDGRNYGKHS
jgi:DNA-binding response OmpR family regulator